MSPWAEPVLTSFCRWNIVSLSPLLTPHFPRCFGGLLVSGEGIQGKVLGEKTQPLLSRVSFTGTAAAPGGTCRKAAPSRNQVEPFPQATWSELGRSWAKGEGSWASVVFRTCSEGPTPERDSNSNVLPGFQASLNFLPFLFGSKCQVSASAQHLWTCWGFGLMEAINSLTEDFIVHF